MGLIEIDVFESLKEILAFIEEQLARNPMAISKKSNHKKKDRVPQRKKIQKVRFLAHSSGSWLHFCCNAWFDGPSDQQQWITGAAVPPVPAPRQGEVLHESKFLREIYDQKEFKGSPPN